MTTPVPELVRLSDGVTLHAITTDKFKTARLSLSFILPADAEEAPLRALFFHGTLMGTERYPRRALLSRRLDLLYGTTMFTRNVLVGDEQVMTFSFDMMEDAFLPAGDENTDVLGGTLEVLSQMLLHPLTDADGLIDAAVIARDKQILSDEIRADRSDTQTYAAARLWSLTYAGEPCDVSLLGTVEAVSAATPAAVTRVWQKLLHTARAEVFYIGRETPETVAGKWRAAFGDWSPAPAPSRPTVTHEPPEVLRRRTEDMPVSQSKLCMSWSGGAVTAGRDAGDEEIRAYLAALVFNELLGGMQSALLFRRVREAEGLCYYCDSDYNAEKGVLSVFCGVRPDRAGAAEESIRAVVDGVRGGDVSESDVALAVLSLSNQYRTLSDDRGGLLNYWFRRCLSGTDETPEVLIARLAEVTPADVIAAARRMREDSVFCLRGTRPQRDDEEVGEP